MTQLFKKITYLYIFGCAGSSSPCWHFLYLWQEVASASPLCCGVWPSHCAGFRCCGARALGSRASVAVSHGLVSQLPGSRAQTQRLWSMGLVAPRHVGSSRTRDRAHIPCIGRWILHPWATRKAPWHNFSVQTTFEFLIIRQENLHECHYIPK